jgi:hypothetical protein
MAGERRKEKEEVISLHQIGDQRSISLRQINPQSVALLARYQPDLKSNLTALFSTLQPDVVAFQGEGLVASPVRWVGSESGLAPYPCWSTCDYASYGAGDPNAPTWFAAETDFTLQNGDK